jgi:uncharacterized protein (DUF1684 family)
MFPGFAARYTACMGASMGKALLATMLCVAATWAGDGTIQQIQQWRDEREAKLKADGGWLTVSGLFWLKEGDNTVGSDPSSDIVLDRGPARIGTFHHQGTKTSFQPAAGVAIEVPATPELRPDEDLIQFNDYTLFVIHRGERDAIRLKDLHSKFRREFTGLHWFPVKSDYRVVAKFVPYDTPTLISIPNILGEVEKLPSAGYAEFDLQGHPYRLEPVVEGDQLFYIFRDLTTGKETYGSGRFLYSDMPRDGKVVLDFNKAYNPPCAFTPYATCPLPPPQNRLAVRVEAGELKYGQH